MLLGQKPDLMLVDEPVAGLTDEETDLTADLLKSLSGENTVVVYRSRYGIHKKT